MPFLFFRTAGSSVAASGPGGGGSGGGRSSAIHGGSHRPLGLSCPSFYATPARTGGGSADFSILSRCARATATAKSPHAVTPLSARHAGPLILLRLRNGIP